MGVAPKALFPLIRAMIAASMAAVVFLRLSGVFATVGSCAPPKAAERLSRLCEGLAAGTESDDAGLVSLVSAIVGKVSASVSMRESLGLLVLVCFELPLARALIPVTGILWAPGAPA